MPGAWSSDYDGCDAWLGGVVSVEAECADSSGSDRWSGDAYATVVRDAINLSIGFEGVSVAPGL